MSNSSGSAMAVQFIERADIHKSCKAIETLANLFNDYCEVTNLLCGIQKKLYKALKETAAVKGNAEACTNAFGSTSSVFESIVEVDSKFSKIIDKECEVISSEIRKWFKKLAKEEKAHDERLNNANEKIKQAGQAYEKAAKRKSSAALEEHTRYMNVISSVGPEISQDKYDHAVFVTQRHTKLLLGVATAMARVSEVEWIRQCERVRKCASLIGEATQWRVYCEGEWGGRVPADLRDISSQNPFVVSGSSSSREGSGERNTNPTSPDGYPQSRTTLTRSPTPINPQQHKRRISPLPSPSTQQQPLNSSPPSTTNLQEKSQSEFDPSTISSLDGPGFGTLTASFPAPPTALPSSPNTPERGNKLRKSSLVAMNIIPNKVAPSVDKSYGNQEIPVHSDKVDSASSGSGSAGKGSRVAAMRDRYDNMGPVTPTSPSSSPPKEELEEKDKKPAVHFRRTSVNVADLASRYEPSTSRPSLSPPPQVDARQNFPAKLTDSMEESPLSSSISSHNATLTNEPGTISDKEDESTNGGVDEQTIRAADRTRRMQELRQLAFEEHERILQEEQKRLEIESRELQAEKMRLESMRSSDNEQTRAFRPHSSPYGRVGYSQSYTHVSSTSISSTGVVPHTPLASPSPKQSQKFLSSRKPRLSLTSSSSTSLATPTVHPLPSTPGHPVDCNCVSCVLHRPADAPNPVHLRTSKTDKPRGFFKRLSMEVGNTFSLSESGRKRSNSNLNLQSAVHASTVSGSGGGYYGVGSGIGSDSVSGGRYGRGLTGAAPSEVGVLPRDDYVPSRR